MYLTPESAARYLLLCSPSFIKVFSCGQYNMIVLHLRSRSQISLDSHDGVLSTVTLMTICRLQSGGVSSVFSEYRDLASGWVLSNVSINSQLSMPARTLSRLYSDPDLQKVGGQKERMHDFILLVSVYLVLYYL